MNNGRDSAKERMRMYEQKMKENDDSVVAFIESLENEKKKADACRLLEIFEETTGFPAKMWGYGIIGFGKYHYKYASGHEGDAPLVGFSPRKGKFSLYLAYESEEQTVRPGQRAGFDGHPATDGFSHGINGVRETY
jgi:hypothetical protein